jgi:sigma-B regulation protein RsbU (phosphoserine phosphatase)
LRLMIRKKCESDGRTATAVARQSLFAGVPTNALHALLAHCEVLLLEGGERLLAAGQANRTLYLLLEGQLKVHLHDTESEAGFLVGPGECIGEISIIDGKPATAHVLAGLPSLVLAIPEAVLWDRFFALPSLARNFMRLFAARFRERNEAIRSALEQRLRYEHLQKELAIARDIQFGMLPRDLNLAPELEIAAEMSPARHVGGDFYDAFPVSREEYCVAVGDVAGKGVPAALFVVRTMALLRTEMLKGEPISDALSNLNALLCEENPTDMFVTLSVGLINVGTGRFVYVNAGHDAIVFGKHGASYRWLPRPHGILAGVDEGATYGVAALEMAAGDILLLHTDGVTEAMNGRCELFTAKRLMTCLEKTPASSAQDLAKRIKLEVQQFVGEAPQSDDLTTLILRYRGRGQAAESAAARRWATRLDRPDP